MPTRPKPLRLAQRSNERFCGVEFGGAIKAAVGPVVVIVSVVLPLPVIEDGLKLQAAPEGRAPQAVAGKLTVPL
jgi:hypothetical protein